MYTVRITRIEDGQLLRNLQMSLADALELVRTVGFDSDSKIMITMEAV